MNKINCFLLAIVIAIVMTACSSTSKVATTAEPIKTLTVPQGKAVVYILRPAFMGFAINFKVFVDGTQIGVTKGKTYIYTAVDPGKHTIMSQAENKEELAMVFEEGKTYFIEQIPTMGALKARNKLVKLDEAAAIEKLGKCKIAKDFKPNF
jgi:hypothetical protein